MFKASCIELNCEEEDTGKALLQTCGGLRVEQSESWRPSKLCANYLTARCLGFPLVRRVKDSELAKLCGNRDGTINRLVQCLTHGRHTRKPVF